MVALTDIVSPSESGVSVTIRGQQVPVHGIGVRGLANLLIRYPEFQTLIQGKDVNLSPARLFEIVPDAISAVIAAGLGKPGDEATEAAADSLTIEEQVDVLEKIVEVTLPKGIAPFVERLTALLGSTGAFTTVPDTKSRSRLKT